MGQNVNDENRRKQAIKDLELEKNSAKIQCPACKKDGIWKAGKLSALVPVDVNYSPEPVCSVNHVAIEDLVISLQCSSCGNVIMFSALKIGAEPRREE